MGEMFDLLGQPAEITDKPDAKALEVPTGEVVLDDVVFGYETARPILKGVSLSVPGGQTVAIVGPSGSGKSTIGRLLFRFYDVNDGAVRIDGQDPVTGAVFHQKPIQPICPKTCFLVAVRCMPNGYVRLIGQIFKRPIRAVVIDDQEMVDPQIPVILEKIWETDLFISQRGEQQVIVLPDILRTVRIGAKFAPF